MWILSSFPFQMPLGERFLFVCVVLAVKGKSNLYVGFSRMLDFRGAER